MEKNSFKNLFSDHIYMVTLLLFAHPPFLETVGKVGKFSFILVGKVDKFSLNLVG